MARFQPTEEHLKAFYVITTLKSDHEARIHYGIDLEIQVQPDFIERHLDWESQVMQFAEWWDDRRSADIRDYLPLLGVDAVRSEFIREVETD